MIIVRDLEPQRSKQKNLPRRRFQQIGPAHNFGDPHRGIVNNNRQLIGGNVIASPNNEVAKVLPGNQPLLAKMQIRKENFFTVWNPKPPIRVAKLRVRGDG